jgi:hypothetical protein
MEQAPVRFETIGRGDEYFERLRHSKALGKSAGLIGMKALRSISLQDPRKRN